MAKRSVSAFGADDSSESTGAVTSGKIPARGVQRDATPSKSDEPSKIGSRKVRAFGNIPRCAEGGMQQDHGRGSVESKQFAETGEFMTDGGNSAGRTMKGVDPYFADNCQGRSGQADNQSTNRGKGTT